MIKVKTFQFNPFGENTYIVSDEVSHEAAIIDPGMMYRGENELLDEYVADEQLKIKYLINTHIHVDHVSGDEYVEKKYGVGLSASPLDLFLASRIAEQGRMFHLPFKFPETIEIAHPLNDGDTLMLGEHKIEVIAVPGHSPGSIAIYIPSAGIVFSGDALFEGSIGRTDLPGGSYPVLVKSISDRLLVLPSDTKVYSGHGSPTTIGYERDHNPYV